MILENAKKKETSDVTSIANMPGLFLEKDANFLVTAITKDTARLCGWKNPEDAIGFNDYDMPCPIAKFAADFLKLDELCVRSNSKLHAIQVIPYGFDWRVMLTERIPIKDESDNLIKLQILAMDITATHLSKGILFLNSTGWKILGRKKQQINYIISSSHFLPSTLTEKQELCLFLLIRGRTLRQIADVMKISIKTVEDHINAIKIKLSCKTKSQLIEKAIDVGFFYHIPSTLLK